MLRDQASTDYWPEWLKKANLEQPLATGPVIVDPNVRVQSAIDGHGMTLANPLLDSTIPEGALCEPFDIRLEGYGYYLVYSNQAEGIRQYQVFRDWLLLEAESMIAWFVQATSSTLRQCQPIYMARFYTWLNDI